MSISTQDAPKFKCFTGVDITAKDFTASTLVPGNKPKLEKKHFEQSPEGFSGFSARLKANNIVPKEHLIVAVWNEVTTLAKVA